VSALAEQRGTRALRDLVTIATSRSGARVRQTMDVACARDAIAALRAAIVADDRAALAICGILVAAYAVVDALDDSTPEVQA